MEILEIEAKSGDNLRRNDLETINNAVVCAFPKACRHALEPFESCCLLYGAGRVRCIGEDAARNL